MELIISGQICTYSESDHELISQYNWYLGGGYARTEINGKGISMHRLIMECSEDMVVDHINNNKLDNRRENLRIVHPNTNAQNKKKRANKQFEYIGVSYHKGLQRYRASITVNKHGISLGCYDTVEAAAEARNMYIVHKLPNSIYPLNFPEKKNEYSARPFNLKLKTNKKSEKKIIDKTMYECTDCDEIIRIIIPSNPDIYVIIDTEDYEIIRHMQFCINNGGYVFSSKYGQLHRLVMGETDPKVFIDHIDGNKFNNTKMNLRKSNAKLNGQNKSKQTNAKMSSQYLGVTKRTLLSGEVKWVAFMKVDRKSITIGRFDSEEEAADARDLYILENFPNSHYKLNFPDR